MQFSTSFLACFVSLALSLSVSAAPTPIDLAADIQARAAPNPNPSRRAPEIALPVVHPGTFVETVSREALPEPEPVAEPQPEPWCRYGCI
ncbi:hypothetical protein PC9H_008000 [Pleurotus ostreatus]|uniref:Uncharacterized protein n=1 Tax=Pleurotus ostreatus TaxID=5322 RepID=A0A8H6ZVY8_PLEOS|nr:uncharacterized protein PC9H_008000 [Pleurotus ostreatus]KAF7428768.1 hypothetical protein PC9H_008000 [Pleurotus ostreatus]KAJ8696975.1 hypothetical protein PTI98_006794 [Pleurotus ostreatus]